MLFLYLSVVDLPLPKESHFNLSKEEFSFQRFYFCIESILREAPEREDILVFY